jgi:hypothetical protein
VVSETLEPGLSVKVTRTVHTIGKKTVVTRVAQALDDGVGVAGATFKIGGRTIKANGAGRAKVPAGRGTATAAGYVAASFRVP